MCHVFFGDDYLWYHGMPLVCASIRESRDVAFWDDDGTNIHFARETVIEYFHAIKFSMCKCLRALVMGRSLSIRSMWDGKVRTVSANSLKCQTRTQCLSCW